MKNRRALAIGVVLSSLALASCASGGGAAAPEPDGPFHLAVMYGLSGPYAGYADSFFDGMDAGVAEINSTGGILGREVVIDLIDTHGDPTFAVTALQEKLDSGYRPDAIVPSVVAGETLAVLPMVTEAGLLAITPAISPQLQDSEAYPTLFGLTPQSDAGLAPLGPLMKAEGVKTLGVIAPADAAGDGFLKGITSVAADNGIKITVTERPSPEALNFTVEYQRVLEAKPDAVYADFNSFDSLSRIFDARATVGGTSVPYFAGNSTSGSVPATLVDPASLEGCSMPVMTSMVQQDDEPEFLTPLLDAYEGSGSSAYAGAIAYDLVSLFALAVERAEGDVDGQALTEALLAEPIAANTLTQFPGGFEYSDEYRFPTIAEGDMTLVPCASTISDGLWVTTP